MRVIVKAIVFEVIDDVEQLFFGFDLFDPISDFLIFFGGLSHCLDTLLIGHLFLLDLFLQLIDLT